MDIVLSKLKSPAILPRIPALIDEVIAAVDTDLTPLEALKQVRENIPRVLVKVLVETNGCASRAKIKQSNSYLNSVG